MKAGSAMGNTGRMLLEERRPRKFMEAGWRLHGGLSDAFEVARA